MNSEEIRQKAEVSHFFAKQVESLVRQKKQKIASVEEKSELISIEDEINAL